LLPSQAKVFVLNGNVFINKIPTNSINKRAAIGDYITFRNLSQSHLLESLRRKIYHIRHDHFVINFRLPCIHYMKDPDPLSLFNYFSISHAKIFFSTNYRRR